MKPKLSIIIPCYNCEKTIEEAIKSCYTQEIEDFEIILVDDKSTDNTRSILNNFSQKYNNIKIFSHDKNRGGGATRNTAVKNSSSDIIFCLDSDDILPNGTLKKMYDFLILKKCDGVGLHKSIKFNGKNIKDIERIDIFGYVNEKIPRESLIERKGEPLCPLYVVFMFTKKAWEISGGYPEDHGFDTQGFAWRFLLNGLTAYTCPEASYLHRINFHKSYYLREYFSGKINLNWIKIFSEFLTIFSDEIIKKIIKFNINSSKNVMDEICKNKNIFQKKYAKEEINESNLEGKKDLSFGEYYWLLFKKTRDGTLDEKFIKTQKYKLIPNCIRYNKRDNIFIFKDTEKITLIKRIYRKFRKLTNNLIDKYNIKITQ